MRSPFTLLALLGLAPGLTLADDLLMQGKTRTDRSIVLDVVLNAPPETVFELWTTREGVRSFLAPEARIDPAVGGRYEILFKPAADPQGEREGTKGARILQMDKGRFLAFEWKGRGEMTVMNAMPLPTWVEIRLEPFEGDPQKTQLHFTHLGFGRGTGWDEAYAFFATAWPNVLAALREACTRARPAGSG